MPRITRHKRRGIGSKKLDISGLREVLKDSRSWAHVGVAIGDGRIEDGDVLVDVQLQPAGEEVTCLVAGFSGGPGYGIYSIPKDGSELVVLIPEGDLGGGGVVVATLSTGSLPDGITAADIVISCPSGGKIYLNDGSGGTEPLITKSQFDAHKHPTGTGPSGIPDNAATSGTSVVEGK